MSDGIERFGADYSSAYKRTEELLRAGHQAERFPMHLPDGSVHWAVEWWHNRSIAA